MVAYVMIALAVMIFSFIVWKLTRKPTPHTGTIGGGSGGSNEPGESDPTALTK